MIIYLKEQFLVHAAHSAKQVMQHKGHRLKKNMPANISKKNALRIARYRNKNYVDEDSLAFEEEKQRMIEENDRLNDEMTALRDEVHYYHKQYGAKKKKHVTHSRHTRLQEITSLQRELINQQLEAQTLKKQKKISKEEYDELVKTLTTHENALRKKKQKLLLG